MSYIVSSKRVMSNHSLDGKNVTGKQSKTDYHCSNDENNIGGNDKENCSDQQQISDVCGISSTSQTVSCGNNTNAGIHDLIQQKNPVPTVEGERIYEITEANSNSNESNDVHVIELSGSDEEHSEEAASDDESSLTDERSVNSSSKNSLDNSVPTTSTSVHGKDWGWFDDVNDHSEIDSNSIDVIGKRQSDKTITNTFKMTESGGLVCGKTVNLTRDNRANAKKKNDIKKKKNKGGLLQFSSSEIKPLNDIVSQPKKADMHSAMAVTAPNYVLEESLSSQRLWKDSAGTRPPQPVEERAYFEKLWSDNFAQSSVDYQMPDDVLTASSPISLCPFADGGLIDSASPNSDDGYSHFPTGAFNANNFGVIKNESSRDKDAEADAAEATLKHLNTRRPEPGGDIVSAADPNYYSSGMGLLGPHQHQHTKVNKKFVATGENGEEEEFTVLFKGDNVFGTTVSKSFARSDLKNGSRSITTFKVSVPSYRVVESSKHKKYAQFLVVFCEGSFKNTVGVWKRFSDFENLSREVANGNENCKNCATVLDDLNPLSIYDDQPPELLPNAATSWRLLKKRQRWYRCLEAGYLSLKVFLLERFLHDILFESSSPHILRDFVGVAA